MKTRTRPTLEKIRRQRDVVLRIAAEHGASHVRIFGSVARGDSIQTSDIDILVDMSPGLRGLEYFGALGDLQRALAAALGYGVDVIDSGALHKRMKDRVLSEAVLL
ncbi:MAG: nucleotidyltransferase family protein [Chloroflexota bacterium]